MSKIKRDGLGMVENPSTLSVSEAREEVHTLIAKLSEELEKSKKLNEENIRLIDEVADVRENLNNVIAFKNDFERKLGITSAMLNSSELERDNLRKAVTLKVDQIERLKDSHEREMSQKNVKVDTLNGTIGIMVRSLAGK